MDRDILSGVPAEIIELVDKFERNLEAYKNPSYKEEQLKQEFINPLFKALGWDVDNISGSAPQYRDVIFEDSIKIASGTKAPDYCFTLAGRKMFFVEAKKPSVNIDKDIKPSYQLRRYAWSAKLPLSILTDFEEMAIYESRSRPKKSDRASTGRIKYLTYKDYVEEWDYLSTTFSKDAVLKGTFDKYADSTNKKKGTSEVDDEFLSEIETWREVLARDIALRNPDLTVEELNYSVQQIIDRIIFLRMAEDRGAEKYGLLQKLLARPGIYHELCEIWNKADEKYNSGLFHFKNEKNQKSAPDTLTPQLEIKDGVFKQIIKNLYYPDSPYEFSVLSPEILGNVYEQFLGKVIRLTKGHRAKVEEKPEVKKAGGVYYTPQYIVEFIVDNTIGKLCKDKTPQKLSELRILDPACGSGSFLLGAYNYLLNWHLIYYTRLKNKNRLKDQIYKGKNNEWHLTIKEKKRILLNNIYGVDIDHQAVEVTKLSLLLKVLEGENKDVLEAQQKLYKERALPNLENNIKCGNSLIGPDIYKNAELELNTEDIKRINTFNWDNEFDWIITNGGFDAVIGNPPWGSLFSNDEKVYLKDKYLSKSGSPESHLYFIEKASLLLRKEGLLGFITPNMWFVLPNAKNLREYLLKNGNFTEIRELSKYIFDKAPDMVPTIFFYINKQTSSKCLVKKANTIKVTENNFNTVFSEDFISQSNWINDSNFVINIKGTKSVENLKSKIKKNSIELSNISDVSYGIKTGNNSKYLSKQISVIHNKKALKTGELIRYNISYKGLYLQWSKNLAGYRERSLEVPKIIIQYIRKLSLPRRLIAAIDTQGVYYPLNNYSYITKKDDNYSLYYLLGIINSDVMNFYFSTTFIDYNIKPTYIKQLPIYEIDFKNLEKVTIHDKIDLLVKDILSLYNDLKTSRTPQNTELIQRQIVATDKQINDLVYELYGITEEDAQIIEDMNR